MNATKNVLAPLNAATGLSSAVDKLSYRYFVLRTKDGVGLLIPVIYY